MYPSNLVWSLVSAELLQQGLTPKKMNEMIALEKKLRKDKHLLGSGFEIQYIAIKS